MLERLRGESDAIALLSSVAGIGRVLAMVHFPVRPKLIAQELNSSMRRTQLLQDQRLRLSRVRDCDNAGHGRACIPTSSRVYPLTQTTGASFATLREIPAWSAASTTALTSL